ncbi:MAG: hypothetical protein CL878_00970 [Dehalococcoidia bacterium]|nr:hypothetical protein [Dehalococcoidia bacterium]
MAISFDSIHIVHDVEADAASVQLRDASQHHTGFPDGVLGGRYIHYDAKGRIRAFEFVAVSKGVNLQDFPEPEASAAAAALLREGFIIRYELPRRARKRPLPTGAKAQRASE